MSLQEDIFRKVIVIFFALFLFHLTGCAGARATKDEYEYERIEADNEIAFWLENSPVDPNMPIGGNEMSSQLLGEYKPE